LRAFAISLGGNVDRADDLVQRTDAPARSLAPLARNRALRSAKGGSRLPPWPDRKARSPKYRQHVREADCIGVHFSPPRSIPRIAWQNTIRLPPSRTYQVAETTINMVDALRGQQAQLRRLLAQKVLIGDAPKTTLSEMQALVIELRRLLAELERAIQDQLQQGRK
jgi:hypothetical protein